MKAKNRLMRALGIFLCAVLVAVLITLVFMNHRRNSERAEAIRQRADDLKQEESEKLDRASDIYEDMILDLNLNSIACWGDNEMAGSESLSLPKALREVADENLFTPVTTEFAAVIDLEDRTIPSMKVDNLGVSNEGMNEIMVRAGVNGLKTAEWMMIPSDTEPRNIALMDENNRSLRFAEQREVGFGQVSIADIDGSLVVGDGEYDEDHPRFAFARDEEGDSYSVGTGTEVRLASADKYVGAIPVFFFEDDTAYDADDFAGELESMVWHYVEDQDVKAQGAGEEASAGATDAATSETAQAEEADAESGEESGEADTAASETAQAEEADAESGEESGEESEELPLDAYRFVVICTADEGSDLDNELSEMFGNNYIRNNRYAYEMTEDNYKELAQKVYEKLEGQGCFDSVKKTTEKAVEDLSDLSVLKEH